MDDHDKEQLLRAILMGALGGADMKVINMGGEGRSAKGSTTRPPSRAEAEKLEKVFKSFNEPCDFEVGDFVTIKDKSMSVWRGTDAGTVMVCLEKLKVPRAGYEFTGPEYSPASSYAAMQYDCILGWLADDGTFRELLYDSRRFKKYDKPSKTVVPMKRKST